MRIVVPYVAPAHERTIATVDLFAPEADWVELDPTDQQGYYRLLCELWAAGDDFMIVEHDMELLGGEVEAFASCPSDWCTYPYAGSQPIWTGRHQDPAPRAPRIFRCALGCTRFGSSLLQELPEAVSHISKRHPVSLTAWNRLDSQIASYLFQHGKRTCEHEPHVVHHHDYGQESTRG